MAMLVACACGVERQALGDGDYCYLHLLGPSDYCIAIRVRSYAEMVAISDLKAAKAELLAAEKGFGQPRCLIANNTSVLLAEYRNLMNVRARVHSLHRLLWPTSDSPVQMQAALPQWLLDIRRHSWANLERARRVRDYRDGVIPAPTPPGFPEYENLPLEANTE